MTFAGNTPVLVIVAVIRKTPQTIFSYSRTSGTSLKLRGEI